MTSPSFACPRQPALLVEQGGFLRLPEILRNQGFSRPAIITAGGSLRGRPQWDSLLKRLGAEQWRWYDQSVQGEPGPALVNSMVDRVRTELPDCDVVVAVGGGSVLDAAKALAAGCAMAAGEADPHSFDITAYLEGVGDREPSGATLPLIAFPSTAGTGSEATANAVLSTIGPGGFKKSLRHDNFIPLLAVIDGDLHKGCPLEITRAGGLDAITQLLEAYLSTRANPLTDALALQGLTCAGEAFPALLQGEDTPVLREKMALAAYLSGVCLAAVGLGLVHGFASPLGAMRNIPHGAVCGILLGPVSRRTLREADGDTVARYGRAARALGLSPCGEVLAETVQTWAAPLGRLGDYGFTREDLDLVVAGTGLKNHPLTLDKAALTALLGEVL
ncbi:Alcohol dehydrogenase, class IV [Alkalispirochaeta americana]|uniref:Alcohol dehydrogenase, class IV n=1 Tax=Alkalispirochaeta americana TaxID=159291 RepID=A0A1N6UHP3_9SPIO|nr:iron-containing alcohol dehydrogenase [Alkalispirochaeta americana]SIQ65155.1 Alcohol dehydrogenase, class IV [Alkalispirochaeta americana]